MHSVFGIINLLGFAIAFASLVYILFAIRCLIAFKSSGDRPATELPPATLFKPVCGMDPGLLENLRAFCTQDYPLYQIIFGAARPDDPAIAIIRQIMKEFPHLDISLVIDSKVIGPNLKVSNLANMYPLARHDVLVISDSDMRPGENYLCSIVTPLLDKSVGAVTCLYQGIPATRSVASRLACLFINEWFLPSVLVARAVRGITFCLGATMVVRRNVLEGIGGFERLASYLADDYMLGKLVSDQGYKVVLSPYVVKNIIGAYSFKSLFMHELRWARTVRNVQPAGYALSFVTYTIPLSLVYCVITSIKVIGICMLIASIIVRLVMHGVARRTLQNDGPPVPWLLPLRDLMCFMVWAASFMGHNVSWRNNKFSLQSDGHMAFKE
jgi:ceramide glucosyltransferase